MAGQIEVNPYTIIGEKQVRLELLTQYAAGLEQQIATQQATIEAQAARILELDPPADPEVDAEDEAQRVAREAAVSG